jgi:uncharacterized protein
MPTGEPSLLQLLRHPPLPRRTGTVAEDAAQPPRAGRFKVVRGGDQVPYLYVPQIQELFDLDAEMAAALAATETDAVAVAGGQPLTRDQRAAAAMVDELAAREPAPPLSEKRFSHAGLRDVVVHVSQKCNLDCVYCYATEINKANQLMTREVADAVVEKTMEMAPEGLSSVKFLGGEPTIAWPMVDYLMDRYRAASAAANVPPPAYTIVTNGTLMTPHIVASMAANRMYVLVSLDGEQSIHDFLRPNKAGDGSYLKASAALRALVDAGVNVAVESVYTRHHYERGITPQQLVDHFLSLGVRHFHISIAIGVWHQSDTIDEAEDVARLFSEAARGSIRSYRTPSPYLLRGVSFVLDGFALRERARHVCGAGRTFMGVNFDGQAFPCYLLQSPETSYGFIGKSWDEDRYRQIRTAFEHNGKEYHRVCRECWANEICHSCLGTSWHIAPGVTKPPAWFCAFQKTLIAAVLGEIADARVSADWPRFLDNMKDHLLPLRGVPLD